MLWKDSRRIGVENDVNNQHQFSPILKRCLIVNRDWMLW